MQSFTLSISGNEAGSQKVKLVYSKKDDKFVVDESHYTYSMMSGQKLIPEQGRVLTFNSISGAANYAKAIGITGWEAEINDQEKNIVRKVNDANGTNLGPLIEAYGALVQCEWSK